LLSPFVLAGLDCLLAAKVSADAGLALLDEATQGRYRLESFSSGDVSCATRIIRGYSDFGSLAWSTLPTSYSRNVTTPWIT
jgi:hypothetical protein